MGCVAAKINLKIYEGGTFDQTFRWSTGLPSVVVDLTGYTAKFSIRKALPDVSPLFACETSVIPWAADVASGIYIDAPESGEFRIYINDDDTEGLCAQHADLTCVYDLFLHNPAGEVLLKQYGSVKIKAAVTR